MNHDELLKKAVTDRDKHPWRYYRLDHEQMKKICDEQAARIDALLGRVQELERQIDVLRDMHKANATEIERLEREVARLETENADLETRLEQTNAE